MYAPLNSRSPIGPTARLRLAVAVLLLSLGGGCSKQDAGRPLGKRPAPSVIVAPALRRNVPIELVAPVDLRPLEQVEVGSKVLGYLDAILVERGDRVRKGQTVALLRPSDLPDQLAAARSSLTQAQASAALAKSNFERASKLSPAGMLSDQELEQSRTEVLAKEAAEATSKAQLEALAVRLGETKIASPIDGLIAFRKLDPGALVGPSAASSIVTVMRVDRLRAFAAVPEAQATAVTVGMPARILLDAARGEQFLGTVVRVSPAIDPNTRALEAEVQVDNRDGRLRPGMYGRGYIRLSEHPQATVVPVNAVIFGGSAPRLFVAQGNRVSVRVVSVGAELESERLIEILAGVNPDELVVTAGTEGLVDGTEVTIRRSPIPELGRNGAGTAPASATPSARP